MSTITLTALASDIRNFLKFKRAMGYSYRRQAFMLESFRRFARDRVKGDARTGNATIQLKETVAAWLTRTENRKPNTIAAECNVVRKLCLYRRRSHPDAFVPDQSWTPKSRLPFLPYVFSRKEVAQLLAAAKHYHHANVGPRLMRTLLLILYCTGVRFGEAVRLQLSDVDMANGMLLIRESKGRSRSVPFGKDLGREIQCWLAERAQIVSLRGAADALFLREDGRVLRLNRAGEAVTRLVRQQALKPSRGRIGPRPYDWRHTHAVHRLTDWYRQGVDIHARLPWLSAYMGHLNVLGTEVYLHATPELLRLASRRLKGRLQRTQGHA